MKRPGPAITILTYLATAPGIDRRPPTPKARLPMSPLSPSCGIPLTAFEEHMLLDDRPSHPMAIVTRFDFVDGPPPASLESAFHDTLQSEPLLSARIDRSTWGRPRWAPGVMPRLARSRRHASTGQPVEWTGALPRLDARTGPVLHAEVIEHDAGWSLLVAVHHAAADGIGLVGFVERWLLASAGKPGRWRRRPADVAAALSGRGRVASSWRQFGRLLPRLAKGLEGVREFMAHDVAHAGAVSIDGRRPDAGLAAEESTAWRPLILSTTLDESTVVGMDARAKADAVSVNDLLAAALFASLGDSLAAATPPPDAGPPAGTPWIRIGVPISLRTKDDHNLPAANRVGLVFIDRHLEDRHDRPRLAIGIRDQMEIIRTHALGHVFSLSLEAARWLPGGLERTATRPQPQCTAILSNVGRFFHRSPLTDPAGMIRVAGARLAGWWGVPPIRPGTALAVGTHETAGRRTITFHVDRACLSFEAATRLLEGMTSGLAAFASPARFNASAGERAAVP